MDKLELSNFCDKYDVTILDDSRRYYRHITPIYESDLEKMNHIDVETAKIYTISIPEHRMRDLIEIDRLFYNDRLGMYDNGNGNNYRSSVFEKIMDQKQHEKHLRDTHDSVRIAYEQYQMMLALASSKKL